MKKLKKILIIGDSNCIPLYLEKKDQNVPINEIYISKLKKRIPGAYYSEVIWGGITTSMLINYSINYYKNWQPEIIIVHSGVNDVKTQLFSDYTNQKIFKLLKIFKIKQKDLKNKLFYNPKFVKYSDKSKVKLSKFISEINKLKNNFKKSYIIWIGIHSNFKIDKERPNTFKNIKKYNEAIKEIFKENFIDNNFNNNCFRKDGYHLNKKGHIDLYKKIISIISRKYKIQKD